jgi:hypothetical protein
MHKGYAVGYGRTFVQTLFGDDDGNALLPVKFMDGLYKSGPCQWVKLRNGFIQQ